MVTLHYLSLAQLNVSIYSSLTESEVPRPGLGFDVTVANWAITRHRCFLSRMPHEEILVLRRIIKALERGGRRWEDGSKR